MTRNLLVVIGIVAVCSGAARAQQVDLIWSWVEDPGHPANNNGILEPGEAARISVRAQVTGIGTQATYQSTTGTITGLGIIGFDLRAGTVINGVPNTSGIAGNQLSVGQAAGWSAGPLGAFSGATSWVTVAGAGQPLPATAASPTENTAASVVRIWEEIWTPTVFAGQVAYFTSVDDPGSSVILRYGTSPTEAIYMPVSTVHHLIPPGIQIPIAPAPGALVIVLIPGLLCVRRRRTAG